MDRNFQQALKGVLVSEGGYVDDPKDPGGATNKGVTLATFRRFVKPNGTKEDLKKITAEQVATVYRRQYWDEVHGAELPDGLDYSVFDAAVMSGPKRAALILQAAVGASQDGKIGPATLEAVEKLGSSAVITAFTEERLAFLKRAKGSAGTLKGKLLWPTYSNGWGKRVHRVEVDALKMAAQPTPEKPSIIVTEVEKPVVPQKVEKEVRQKTNWLSSIFGGLFGAGGFTAWLAGMDKDALLLVAGIAVVVVVVVLVGGEWLIQRIRSIKKAVEE